MKQKAKKQVKQTALQKQAKKEQAQKTQQPATVPKPVQNSSSPISSLSPNDVAQLQRTIGNQALARLQTKLTVGPAGDQYEQEADNVAAQVVNQINTPAAQTIQPQEEEEVAQKKPLSSEISSVQRQEDEEVQTKSIQRQEDEEVQAKSIQRQEDEEVQAKSIQRQEDEEVQTKSIQRQEDEEVQTKSIQRQEDEEVQTKSIQRQEEEEVAQAKSIQRQEEEEVAQAKAASAQGGPVADTTEEDIQGAKGSGAELDDTVRGDMENAFGADFSGVKVHTDSQSDHLNESLNARAFTTGQDIFFRQGEYNPGSQNGQELLAHELTHVVQQNGTAVQPKTDNKVQRQETGMAQGKAVTRYASKSLKVFQDWDSLSPQQRANDLGKYVNAELKKANSFQVNIRLADLGGDSGQFDFTTWTLDIDSTIVNKDTLSDPEKIDLVDTVYHEARHSEQWYRMACLKAGEGLSAKQIADSMFIPANVAAEAAKHPLKPLSKFTQFFMTKEHIKLHNKKLDEAKSWYDSVYGDLSEHRNDVLGDIDNRYDEYRQLAEEVDAWDVGSKAGKAFKELLDNTI